MTPRIVTLVSFVCIAVLAWGFLWQTQVAMSTMAPGGWLSETVMIMMQPHATSTYLTATAVMWIMMMIAMMTPAVLPVVHVFWQLERGDSALRIRHGALFGASYLLVWCGFGVAMAVLQWGLHRGAMLRSDLLEVGPVFAACLAIAAGLYQLTPLKTTCLNHCQSPLGFLMSHWRSGGTGAIRMGIAHGAYCLGCCWALMLLMFVGGVMSVGVMIAISFFILLERLLPAGPWITKLPGAVMLGWGTWTLFAQI